MEVEEKKTYVFNGVEYSTWTEAWEAKTKYQEEQTNKYDAAKAATGYENFFNNKWNTRTVRLTSSKETVRKGLDQKVPFLIVVTDKYDSEYLLIRNEDDIKAKSLKILKYRVNDDYWYQDDQAKLAKYIVENDMGGAAFTFLEQRSDYEYEKFRIEYFS